MIDYPERDVFWSCDLLRFREISDDMSEMVQIETYLQWKINWKLYVAC